MSRICEKLVPKKLKFTHVCEVGVYHPETTHLAAFIHRGVRTTLVEADPEAVARLQKAFGFAHVSLHPVAVWDTSGKLELSQAAASTFATALPNSPALANDGHELRTAGRFEVPCVQFSAIDDGTIDLLSIDVEGGEWYVLKHMRSRPKVLSLETHGKYYTNPFLSEIRQWLSLQGYELWYKDDSDSVFILCGLFPISLADRACTFRAEMTVQWKKAKRFFLKGRVHKRA